ncbi:hypothetical protein SISNIDRAFT_444877 [Sistotremastrum niveocremeum HHB9708]|uniref:Protein kinase domain-containing protein n=1 Tax=Sistotremastrum niveocremeum HHB9708 TaxID=1314777 RepID=A0A164QP22_9AGAM|nr:hypothetical protein SISNIDRAFT_444877 [Sistotremastrum niveocremeum HHB9708]
MRPTLGYDLRRRYQPGWTPSWLKSGLELKKSEDAIRPDPYGTILDATRRRDNLRVVMKLVPTRKKEIPVWQYLSSPTVGSDPRNHTVPLLALHLLPDTDEEALAIMPLLIYFDLFPFETPGEVLSCLFTLTEGLVFLHDHNVAHLDFCSANTMMDPGPSLFPRGFHPARPSVYTRSPNSLKLEGPPPMTSRTLAPVQYYIIDFGESIRYKSVADRRLISGSVGHFLDIPDFANGKFYDPFKLDVRAFGEIKKEILEIYHGLDPLTPWIEPIRADQPDKRPTAVEALEMFKSIIGEQKSDYLGSHLQAKGALFRTSSKTYRRHRLKTVLLERPPINPPILGLDLESPKPLTFISRTMTRLSLLFA